MLIFERLQDPLTVRVRLRDSTGTSTDTVPSVLSAKVVGGALHLHQMGEGFIGYARDSWISYRVD